MKSVILFNCMWLLSCKEIVVEQIQECGMVERTTFSPGYHSVHLTDDSDGKLKIVHSDVPPVYGVLFKCQHGTFVVTGSSYKYKVMYHTLSYGDPVLIRSNAVFQVDYSDPDVKNFQRYEFITAEKDIKCTSRSSFND